MSTISQEITRLQNAKAALKESIEAKGVTVEDSAKLDEYPALVDNIPQGGGGVEEKDVNFYDYDGTCVYSYTKDEFLALSEMPALPDHSEEGLVSKAWSCTFEYARISAKMGHFSVIATYSVENGVIKIFMSFPAATTIPLKFTFPRSSYTSATLDWGDGVVDTINSSTTSFEHSYEPGDYCIIITPEQSNRLSLAISSGRSIFGNNVAYNYLTKYVKKVFFGNAFVYDMVSLLEYFSSNTKILLDKDSTQLNYQILSSRISAKLYRIYDTNNASLTIRDLKCLYLSGITQINQDYICENVMDLIIKDTLNNFSSSFMRYTYSLATIHFPNTITQINGFTNSYKIECLCCFATIPPTLSSTSPWSSCGALKIYVPAESVEAYKAATNWSDLADKIFPIPTE